MVEENWKSNMRSLVIYSKDLNVLSRIVDVDTYQNKKQIGQIIQHLTLNFDNMT